MCSLCCNSIASQLYMCAVHYIGSYSISIFPTVKLYDCSAQNKVNTLSNSSLFAVSCINPQPKECFIPDACPNRLEIIPFHPTLCFVCVSYAGILHWRHQKQTFLAFESFVCLGSEIAFGIHCWIFISSETIGILSHIHGREFAWIIKLSVIYMLSQYHGH